MYKETNKLIAEFMNCSVFSNGKYEIEDHPWEQNWRGDCCDYSPEDMCYNNNWEWLMPVIEKINNTVGILEHPQSIHFLISNEGKLFISHDIKNTYKFVIDFIKRINNGYKLERNN